MSLPAIILQIAAAKEWGYENYTRFDALGVGMAHPEAMAALLSGGQAEVYLQLSKDKSKPEDILVQLNDPALRFDLTPLNVMKYFDFMYNVGTIKAKPVSWKEIFAPEVHSLPGS